MKVVRQDKIKELIEQYEIETQEELGKRLQECGFQVTQATISRDIREMRLAKKPSESGKSIYTMNIRPEATVDSNYIRILGDAVLSIAQAENIIVIKTVSGMAMAVAAAIDALQINEIVGCIAGDDTIMCAIRHTSQVEQVIQRLGEHIE